MDKNEKYYWVDIFQRFIDPYFSINDYIIFFEWDQISRDYRYVVTPKENKNKFLSFYLHKHDKIDDFEMAIIYTNVGGFNFHNTQKLQFLLAHDDLERFNRFYQDFIDDLREKSTNRFPVDFFIPFSITGPKKYNQNKEAKRKGRNNASKL